MDWFIHWHQAHPIIFELILFSLACLVSIFSPKIHRLITEWPVRTAETLATRRLTYELQLLKRIHGNAYNLILHLTRHLVGFCYGLFLWLVLLWAYSIVRKMTFSVPVFVGIGAGMLVGKIFELRKLLSQLYDYANTVRTLEEALNESKQSKITVHAGN